MVTVDSNGVAVVMPHKGALTRWAEALESGRYKQGTGALRSADDEFCCLGVLCEVAVQDGVIPEGSRRHNLAAYRYAGAVAFLPREVSEWAFGTAGRNVDLVDEDGLVWYATDLNDDQRWSFTEIAAAIRRTFGV